jgi:hypothetical protein
VLCEKRVCRLETDEDQDLVEEERELYVPRLRRKSGRLVPSVSYQLPAVVSWEHCYLC